MCAIWARKNRSSSFSDSFGKLPRRLFSYFFFFCSTVPEVINAVYFLGKNMHILNTSCIRTVGDTVFVLPLSSHLAFMPRRLVIITCGSIDGSGHSLNAFNLMKRANEDNCYGLRGLQNDLVHNQ